MKAWQWFNVVTLLIAVTFAVLLAVVCLMYAVHLDASPRVRYEWPQLVATTLVFWVIAGAAAAAWVGTRRAAAWRWPAEATLLLTLGAGSLYLLRALA